MNETLFAGIKKIRMDSQETKPDRLGERINLSSTTLLVTIHRSAARQVASVAHKTAADGGRQLELD